MEKYWIIVDGKPQGPYTADQLKNRRDFRADLPVWTSRLTDWTTVSQIEELASLLPDEEEEREEERVEEQPQQQEVADFVEQTVEQQPQPQPQTTGWVNLNREIAGEQRPSSYLGWNIAMTLCCCLPAGLIGIIFSSMVNQKWQRGDVEGARKASESAAWCLILSFVLGLVGIPFQMLTTML